VAQLNQRSRVGLPNNPLVYRVWRLPTAAAPLTIGSMADLHRGRAATVSRSQQKRKVQNKTLSTGIALVHDRLLLLRGSSACLSIAERFSGAKRSDQTSVSLVLSRGSRPLFYPCWTAGALGPWTGVVAGQSQDTTTQEGSSRRPVSVHAIHASSRLLQATIFFQSAWQGISDRLERATCCCVAVATATTTVWLKDLLDLLLLNAESQSANGNVTGELFSFTKKNEPRISPHAASLVSVVYFYKKNVSRAYIILM